MKSLFAFLEKLLELVVVGVILLVGTFVILKVLHIDPYEIKEWLFGKLIK